MLARLGALRHTLFFKVYLTVIAAIIVIALTSAAFVRAGMNERDMGWAERRDTFVAAMLPAGDDPVLQQTMVERLGIGFGADIAIYDGAGRLVAAYGDPVPLAPMRRAERRAGNAVMEMPLDGGRVILARFQRPSGPGGRSPLAYLALVASVTALAAWPVVRHLTRRLETLRGTARRWGEGDLSARAPIGGADEIAAVAASFNEAAARIEDLMAAHRTLLANASHELRSPLARLRLATDLYTDSPGDAARAEIVANLAELDELVEEVLLASRLDHVETMDRMEPLDLLALAAEEGARAGVGVEGDAVQVIGDPRLLTRLLRNLVQNALRHGAPPVLVEIRRDAGQASIIVTDHGPGLPDGETERIFEPFYRPPGRAESTGSWGLGLALVRQIATRHGGSVRFENIPGKGARFVVLLPLANSGNIALPS